MFASNLLPVSGAVLLGSMHLASSFLGCGSDPPPPAPEPTPEQKVEVEIDAGEITKNLQPGGSAKAGGGGVKVKYGASAGVTPDSIGGAVEFEAGAGAWYVEIHQGGTQLVASARDEYRDGGQGPDNTTPSGPSTSTVTPGVEPSPYYRYWESPLIEAQVLSPSRIAAIEGGYVPLRFAFCLEGIASVQEFNDSNISGFWIETRDANGNDVMPDGAYIQLVQSPSEYPISSRILYPDSAPTNMILCFEVLNANGSFVTPTDLGMDANEVTFRFGMSIAGSQTNFTFAQCAGLWRMHMQSGLYEGSGMWLGYNAEHFGGLDPLNDPPAIQEVTDIDGNRLSSISPGQDILVTVRNGYALGQVELSAGDWAFYPTAAAPGPNANDVIYTAQVPRNASLGNRELDFRNLGACKLVDPQLIGQRVAGHDYVPISIQ